MIIVQPPFANKRKTSMRQLVQLRDFNRELNNKTHEDKIWLYTLMISRLVFSNVQKLGEIPDNVYFTTSDLETTHFLLKELKSCMRSIQYDKTAKEALFGENDPSSYYIAMMHTLDTTLKAYDLIENAIEIRQFDSALGPLLLSGFCVTGLIALISTAMPWFVPVCLFAGTMIFANVMTRLENNQLNLADKELSTINFKEGSSQPGDISDRETFFAKRFFQHAVKTIGKNAIKSEQQFRSPPTVSSQPYIVDGETRRVKQRTEVLNAEFDSMVRPFMMD